MEDLDSLLESWNDLPEDATIFVQYPFTERSRYAIHSGMVYSLEELRSIENSTGLRYFIESQTLKEAIEFSYSEYRLDIRANLIRFAITYARTDGPPDPTVWFSRVH